MRFREIEKILLSDGWRLKTSAARIIMSTPSSPER